MGLEFKSARINRQPRPRLRGRMQLQTTIKMSKSQASARKEVTLLLNELEGGNRGVTDRLLGLVYSELKNIARGQLYRERQDHTLNTTALVHEAYINLVGQDRVQWKNRSHFLGVAAQAMRRILLNYARDRKALKRGGGDPHVSLDDEENIMSEGRADELIALDDSLERLAAIDARKAQIVECRYFAGLSIEETAKVIGTSPATIKRDWAMARAWLFRDMKED